ncbi:uncharacterized protein C8A04DRAFT_26206 [Dichotomopilus funicola]|uniref:F-box domain-containing protein n=1 Tax=Dichotomopilus funicola TaxID=1934379 RepID=A0AAN6V7T7_9PEZI|nr:hypothetical protein C8A04DRAFT_26206 [Dichotomopilus funicola]
MAAVNPGEHLWEARDQVSSAKDWYYDPARIECRKLRGEVAKYKSLLLKNGIDPASGQKMGNDKMGIDGDNTNDCDIRRLPSLPSEILSRIMEFDLISDKPIINPLHHKEPEKNTFNLALFATSRGFHARSNAIFWGKNTFTFTNPAAVTHFATLPLRFRALIKHVELRIVARFYADPLPTTSTPIPPLFGQAPHPSYLNCRDVYVHLPVITRRLVDSLVTPRPRFRCYAWTQTEDFLSALHAPYNPPSDTPTGPQETETKGDKRKVHPPWRSPFPLGGILSGIPDHCPRPTFLLPSLAWPRIDFVNFLPNSLPMYPNTALFHLVHNHLGQWLPQLRLTGLPRGRMSRGLGGELAAMLRDDGVLLQSDATFFRSTWYGVSGIWDSGYGSGSGGTAGTLFRMAECERLRWEPQWTAQLRNPHRVLDDEYKRWMGLTMKRWKYLNGYRGNPDDDDSSRFGIPHNRDPNNYLDTDGIVRKMAATVFKKLPLRQDSEKEVWVEFDRIKNRKLDPEEFNPEDDHYDERDWVCRRCDVIHAFREEK